MSEQPPLKLIVAYDRNRNEYSLAAHNQTAEETQSFLEEWERHLREGNSFLVLDQTNGTRPKKPGSAEPAATPWPARRILNLNRNS